MKKFALPLIIALAAALAGCSGEPPVTKGEEEGFKHPSKELPAGFTSAPPHGNVPPPAGATPAPSGG